ncbi:MAG: stage V sporulation protein AA [Lachnospiraceae bacterium]|nr:stage V sporulation protein AA [Lachnospiraceae bacterium]
MSMNIYLSLRQNSEVYSKDVLLKDLGSIWCEDKEVEQACKNINIMHIDKDEHVRIPCSVMDIIEAVLKDGEGIRVVNLGETDFIIDYQPSRKRSRLWEWLKTIFVCFTVFFGGAFAIMAFNNDCSVSDSFAEIYRLVMGKEADGPSVIEASYSLGLPVGIIVFFNHFSKKGAKKDPTPIEVQMRNYEAAVNDAIIKNAEREERGIDTA